MERINKGIAEYLIRFRLLRKQREWWIFINTDVSHVEKEHEDGESKYEHGVESDNARR